MIEVDSGPVEAGPGPLPYDVVILPSQVDGDMGSYSSALAGLLGQLRAAGVDTGYWDDAEHRRVRMGAGSVVLELAIGFGTAVVGGAAWEGIKFALEKATGPHDRIKATVLRQRHSPDGVVTSDWFEYRGGPEAFIAALSKVVGPDEQRAERHPRIRPIGRKRR